MRPKQLLFGLLGLALAAAASSADERPSALKTGDRVTLFNQAYVAEVHSRAETYKNGVTITLPPLSVSNQKANGYFVPGANPSADRLFIAAPINGTPGIIGDQLYVLTGADKTSGVFNASNSTATQFFGGAVNGDDGGRPVSVMWFNDSDVLGPKKDRNLAAAMFAGPDTLRFYDLDGMQDNFVSDAVFHRSTTGDSTSKDFKHGEPVTPLDPNMPENSLLQLAPGPNGTMVVTSRDLNDTTIEMGVMDPTQDLFFPVLTKLLYVTQNSPVQIDPENPIPTGLVRISDTEYWLLTSDQDPEGDTDNTDHNWLLRLNVSFPADLSRGTANSLNIGIVGKEDLVAKRLGASTGGIFGLAVGRERAKGVHDLYLLDWRGNLITLTPMVTAGP